MLANWGLSFGGLFLRPSGVTALVAFACKSAETNAETSDQSFDKVLLPWVSPARDGCRGQADVIEESQRPTTGRVVSRRSGERV